MIFEYLKAKKEKVTMMNLKSASRLQSLIPVLILLLVLFACYRKLQVPVKMKTKVSFGLDHSTALTNVTIASRRLRTVTIGLVICGDRLPQALVQIKSLVMFSRGVDLDLRIFQNNISFPRLRDKLLDLQAEKSRQQEMLSFRLYDVWFPESWWYYIYSECSAQRLFFPLLLPDVDKLLYLDSDILLLSSVNDIWKHFSLMNSSQTLAMAPDGCQGYTLKANKVPHYGYHGLNSGVLLMNLAQMRHMDFSNEMRMIYDGFKDRIRCVDQDIMNIYFHFHPQFLYLLPCEFNFGYPYCCNYDACRCKNAEKFGISILHGFSKMFEPQTSHYFGRIYSAFSKHDTSKRKLSDLLTELERTHRNLGGKLGACSKMNATIFGRFENYVQQFGTANESL